MLHPRKDDSGKKHLIPFDSIITTNYLNLSPIGKSEMVVMARRLSGRLQLEPLLQEPPLEIKIHRFGLSRCKSDLGINNILKIAQCAISISP